MLPAEKFPRAATRPVDPAAEINRQVNKTVIDLQDLAYALNAATALRFEYPYRARDAAETANLYAALIGEVARVADDLIGNIIRLGDDVLGVLSSGEIKDSYRVVSSTIGDDWSPLFTAFAEHLDYNGEAMTKDDWTKRIGEMLAAAREVRMVAPAEGR